MRLRMMLKFTREPMRGRLGDWLIERHMFVEEKIEKLAQMML